MPRCHWAKSSKLPLSISELASSADGAACDHSVWSSYVPASISLRACFTASSFTLYVGMTGGYPSCALSVGEGFGGVQPAEQGVQIGCDVEVVDQADHGQG